MTSSEISKFDKHFLKIALNLARRGVGLTGPNPSVGCIITYGQTIIGRGYTKIHGRPHAEIVAIDQAKKHYLYHTNVKKEKINVYTTLEPCAHDDSSPSCAKEIVKFGAGRVVFLLKDPDERTQGKGVSILKSAGIECINARVFNQEMLDSVAGYLKRKKENIPFVSLKIASSINGKIGTKEGESKWISGGLSRKKVQYIRSNHDAILVGKQTLLLDNPRLNLRDEYQNIPQKFIFILDTNLSIPYSKRLEIIKYHETEKIHVFTKKDCDKKKIDQLRKLGLKDIQVGKKNGLLDISEILLKIGNLQINKLLVEGGSSIWTTFIKENFFDEIIIFSGNNILNGTAMHSLNDFLPVNTPLRSFPRLKLKDTKSWGDDIETVWKQNT